MTMQFIKTFRSEVVRILQRHNRSHGLMKDGGDFFKIWVLSVFFLKEAKQNVTPVRYLNTCEAVGGLAE